MNRRFACLDCEVDTSQIGEYYMVRFWAWPFPVWPLGRDDGMLCIGCLEDRLGRRLRPRDFSRAPVNTVPAYRSERLRSRLRV